MLRTLYIVLIIVFSIPVFGQVVANRMETDCNSNSRSVYQAISNKVLFVVSAANNCSICQNEAPSIDAWATANKDYVEVWGAMDLLGGGTSNCNLVNAWKSTYGWGDIFTFPDAANYWSVGSFTYFTVIRPSDSSIVYQGYDYTVAKEKAMESVGISEFDYKNMETTSVFPNPFNEQLTASLGSYKGNVLVKMFDLIGQKVFEMESPTDHKGHIVLDLSNIALEKGYYFIRLELGDIVKTYRLAKS